FRSYLPQYNEIDRSFPISVAEVIQSGLPTSLSSVQRKAKIQEILSMMGLAAMGKRQINDLSGGELQRALLGRALACSPELLILDEPGTYIDQHYKSVLFDILEKVSATCAILLVSHDIGTIMSRVGGVICINKSVHVHPVSEVDESILTQYFGCSIDLLGHGHLPHRVLREHNK
ncbi:MAG: ATP-binding cassette domain-containing protein, partial [Bacteroidaceae bacterium]|nr:ATP-binding cassette domain-containing protein [Bacteroidaceae bacterium]